jgi:hypothetical protein
VCNLQNRKRSISESAVCGSGLLAAISYWEYELFTRNLSKEEAPSEEELNKLGKEAWELAGLFTDSRFVHFYFKRMKD